MSTTLRRLFGFTVSLALVFSMFATTAATSAAPRATNQPTPRDRELIAQARAEGKDSVDLLIAAQDGQNGAGLSDIEALGGSVQVSNDKIDYVLATVPIAQAEKAFAVDGAESLGVDEVLPLEDPRPEGQQNPIPQAVPNVPMS